MAISASNTGGSWDNAKKYIEAEKLITGEKDENGNDVPFYFSLTYYPDILW